MQTSRMLHRSGVFHAQHKFHLKVNTPKSTPQWEAQQNASSLVIRCHKLPERTSKGFGTPFLSKQKRPGQTSGDPPCRPAISTNDAGAITFIEPLENVEVSWLSWCNLMKSAR